MKRTRSVFALLTALLLVFAIFSGCKKEEAPEEPTPAPPTPTPTAAPVSAPAYTQPPLPTPVGFPTRGYINAEGVNIRSAPNRSADIVDIMGENAVLELVAQEGDWYRVDLDGQTVYVSTDLVTVGEAPRKDNMHWAQVTARESQLYKTPDGKDLSEVKLKTGDVVKVLRKFDTYLHVVYGGNLQRYIKEADVAYITEEEFKAAFKPNVSETAAPTATP